MQRQSLLTEVGEKARTMNKNSQSFKHIKKLKQAVETIEKLEGIKLEAIGDQLQLGEGVSMLVYFFGAGVEKDEKLVHSVSEECGRAEFHIAGGAPYGLMVFASLEDRRNFVRECLVLEELALYRLVVQVPTQRCVFFFPRQVAIDSLKLFKKLDIADCLSNTSPQPIPGLHILSEFISQQQEEQLAHAVDQQKWIRLSNRKVQHYGFEFKYGKNSIDKEQPQQPIPQFLQKLIGRLRASKVSPYEFDQLTINCYDPGDGIPSHFDTHSPFEEVFISLSILGDIVMEFQNYSKDQHEVLLTRRSLAIFSSEARFAWKHAIAPRKMDRIDGRLVWRRRRISLTFRTIRHRPCECEYYFYCDSQGYDQEKMKKHNPLLKKYLAARQPVDLTKLTAQEIEREFVEKAYNAFGWTFSNPLHPKVCSFIEAIPANSLVLDIGCGNGYYMKLIERAGSQVIGLERCSSMGNAVSQERVVADAIQLPFRDETFDAVVMVAVWHHFASTDRRKQCLLELSRVLWPQGTAIISVMGLELQDIYQNEDILMEFTLPNHRKGKFEPVNVQKPFSITNSSKTYHRYYHLFSRQELMQIVTSIPSLQLLSLEQEFGNYYLVISKKQSID